MEKIIKQISVCVILHNFLIPENDESNTYFCEEDDCTSKIDAYNELNFPVNDATDENERRNKMTNYFWETHKHKLQNECSILII